MKPNVVLVVSSLFSVLLFTCHVADDIVRGFEEGDLSNLPAVPIAVVWLYGAVLLTGRRSGYVVLLLPSLLAVAIPVVHMRGAGVGVGGSIAASEGAFFFVWTLLGLGVSGLFSLVLCVRGLWSLRGGRGAA